jgi:tRNA-dihydrouridine synthase B
MIKPLVLNNVFFSTNLIQGPLAGVSCAPFRELTWRYSQPAFTCTEMISCKTLLHSSLHLQRRFTHKHKNEGPVCFQLASSDPQELAEATKVATDLGANLIDLNCGCPVNKIRKKGAGSKLLSDAGNLYKLIKAMKENTSVPVSIKIRVDGASSEKNNRLIANAVNDAGADFLIVHGRHWSEQYETNCNYEQIQFFVEEVKVPVIGNGDVRCHSSLKKMLATGCAGVMIARAGMGQPWLIDKLKKEMRGEKFLVPSSYEIGTVFIEHVSELATLLRYEKFAILQARKFAKYYARNVEAKFNFCEELNACEDLAQLIRITRRYFF